MGVYFLKETHFSVCVFDVYMCDYGHALTHMK